MATTAIPATTASTAAAAGASATQKFAENFDNFLKLLTVQLKNQDPTKPMDPSDFTTQLVQFTGVEQQIATNAKLAELIASQNVNQTLASAGYLGSTVVATGQTVPLVNGSAAFTYTLDKAAESATIAISDSSGRLVRRIVADTAAGAHEVSWDGTDNDGNTVKDGAYSVTVTALAGTQRIGSSLNVIGEVTGVGKQNGRIVLSLSGVPVALDQLIEVRKTTGR